MLTRRTFILAGVAGSAALVGAYWWRSRDNQAPVIPELAPLARLDSDAPHIVTAVVPGFLAEALPNHPDARREAVARTVAAVAHAVSLLPPAAQHELGQLFALLGFAPARLVLTGVASDWPHASETEVAAFLDRWQRSPHALQRSAYDALHQLVFAAWYGDARAWPAIGYPGPPVLSP
jgi:hypothetical protein